MTSLREQWCFSTSWYTWTTCFHTLHRHHFCQVYNQGSDFHVLTYIIDTKTDTVIKYCLVSRWPSNNLRLQDFPLHWRASFWRQNPTDGIGKTVSRVGQISTIPYLYICSTMVSFRKSAVTFWKDGRAPSANHFQLSRTVIGKQRSTGLALS